MKALCLVAFFACAGFAENKKVTAAVTNSTTIRIPLIGYVARSSPLELRAVAGVVGADILADPAVLPSGVTAIVPAPGQQYALAVRGDEGQMGWIPLDPGLGDFQAIPGALSQVDRISFSPSGRSAVLYAGASHRLQAITGLPDAARITREIDASPFGATLTATAISDDGAVLLVGFSNGDSGFVAAMGTDGTAQTVYNASSVAALRFLPRVHDALVVDSQANQITMLAGDAFSPRLLAGDAQGVSKPVDVETSSDGDRVYVANAGARNVLMIDVATGNSNALDCSFVPAAFNRLMKSALSITAQDSDGVWVLDTDSLAPWVAFAPKLR